MLKQPRVKKAVSLQMNKDWPGRRESVENIKVRGSKWIKGGVVCGMTSCFLWLKQRFLGLGRVRDETMALKDI